MTDAVFPDIEIYVKQVDLPSILDWLARHFQILDRSSGHHTHDIVLSSGKASIHCLIVEQAAKGNFTSIWFKSDQTPWTTDQDCARDAADYLGCEVRCSAGSWQEDNDETGGWLRVTKQGQSRINWL